MKRCLTLSVALAVGLWVSGLNMALAQGHGNRGSHGKPAETGLENAEAKANVHGDRGIEKAEAKQVAHKQVKHKKSGKAKGHYKAKHKPASR